MRLSVVQFGERMRSPQYQMSQPTDNQIESAYRACASLTRAASSNFYVAFLSLPKELRRAIYATYAFCRLCDDIVDEPEAGTNPSTELDQVELALSEPHEGEYARNPIFTALPHAIDKFDLGTQYFVDVIDGCRMDIDTNRYNTFEDLQVYCRRVASAVGIICVSIFGNQSPEAIRYANDLGIAFQLTNILRDIQEDYNNGRVYLPQEDLTRFGVAEVEFGGGTLSDNFREMMRFQLERTRGYYESGERVIPMVTRGQQCLELMSGFYSRILAKIEARDADVLSQRVSLSASEKLTIIAGVGWRWALRSVSS